MMYRKLGCGKGVILLSESRREENLGDLLELLSESQNKVIEKVDNSYSLSAAVNDMGCYIKNDCSHQIFLKGRLYCFSPDLLEHYTDPSVKRGDYQNEKN